MINENLSESIDVINAIERIADKLRMIENRTFPALESVIVDEQVIAQDRRDILPKSWQCQVAWSIVVELAAAREEGRRACVKHAILASQAPTATVNRRLTTLAEEGWIIRGEAHNDHRLVCLTLTDKAAEVLKEWAERRAERLVSLCFDALTGPNAENAETFGYLPNKKTSFSEK